MHCLCGDKAVATKVVAAVVARNHKTQAQVKRHPLPQYWRCKLTAAALNEDAEALNILAKHWGQQLWPC
jgi:hypothetical protein